MMLKNLLKIKSIVTICITALVVFLAVTGEITGEQVVNIFMVIVAFYFGTQTGKDGDKNV